MCVAFLSVRKEISETTDLNFCKFSVPYSAAAPVVANWSS